MHDKILIVDDENEIRYILTTRIKHAGYRVESAENGEQGIDLYKKSLYMNNDPFSLVILDIMMPGINGIEVLKTIRKEEKLRKIKYEDGIAIIMLTALKVPWMESFNEGCDDYLIKPYEPEELLNKIDVKLNERKEIFFYKREAKYA